VAVQHLSAGQALNVLEGYGLELLGLWGVLQGHAAGAASRGAHGLESVDHQLCPRCVAKYAGRGAHSVGFYRSVARLEWTSFGEKTLDWRLHRLYFYGIYESALGL
jgi:hypothetical protein